MKKPFRILILVLLLLFGLTKLTEWYLELRFEKLINKNPDRAYNIAYDGFDLHTFFKGITLNDVTITPLNKTTGTIVNGTVEYAKLRGFKWAKFLINKRLKVDELQFVSPTFEINLKTDSLNKKTTKANSLQTLFSDVLSRADLDKFQIEEGAIVIKENDTVLKGEVQRINIRAGQIETDSVQLTHIIPFQLGELEVDMDSMFYQVNDYTKAKVGSLKYSMTDESMELNNLSLLYDKDWVAISLERGLQDDVMEFSLNNLRISNINFTSGFWTNLDIQASQMHIDGLSLSMKRNKNLQRPPDVEKPLFKGMLDRIPYQIDLDSVSISNSSVLYGELSVHKQHTGIIEIKDINGAITQLSTFPERQQMFKRFEAHFSARLNDAADMNIDLQVPYDTDAFTIHTYLGAMDMTALSSSLIPLLGVEIKEGHLSRLDYHMNASFYGSNNSLVMDYKDLHLAVYKEYDDGSQHKKGFVSSIANLAIRHHNLPEKHGYQTVSYTTKRNIYRSPFQHIVAGVLDGAKHIVPGKSLQGLLNKKKK